MARGWESKNIESQMEEARKPAQPHRALTEQERAQRQQLETFQLSRRKMLDDLARARSDAHREMLQHALRDLEEKIRALQA